MLVLAAIGLLVAWVILNNQRASFPEWVPVIGTEKFELQADFETAQAVTPGQGQTVNLSGVKVGDVSGVELVDGVARVSMDLEPELAELIHPDASALLRPRTGLQDMTVEIDPGTGSAAIEEGSTIALANTLPNVNLDQILRSLDADTRAYLKLLLAAGSEAFDDGRDRQLSQVLRRLQPTTRDLARINGALAKRRGSLRRIVTNFKLVSEELSGDDVQLAEFVDASNAALGAFANQEQALRASLRGLPGALRETRGALVSSDRLSRQLEPALRRLIPSAEALAPALRETRPFFEQTLAPVRDQIRPFTREVREPVNTLNRLAEPLQEASEGLEGGLTELNFLLNALAYNPPGGEEGYLFYLSWLNHNTNSLFLLQDGMGPIRRGLVMLSCQTANLADGVTATRPFLKTTQEITRVPLSSEICGESPFSPVKGAKGKDGDGEGAGGQGAGGNGGSAGEGDGGAGDEGAASGPSGDDADGPAGGSNEADEDEGSVGDEPAEGGGG